MWGSGIYDLEVMFFENVSDGGVRDGGRGGGRGYGDCGSRVGVEVLLREYGREVGGSVVVVVDGEM